jgi:Cu/Ag efflux protein CusF
MSENLLDSFIDTVYAKVNELGLKATPITIGVTVLALLSPLLFMLGLAIVYEEDPPAPPAGCRKIGIETSSNLSDQYSKKYSQGADPSSGHKWRVKALFIYPVKSCKGVEVDKSDIVNTGLKYDRQFSLAQYVTSLPDLQGKVKSEWTFITQRTFPRLAKVETQLWVPDPGAPGYAPDAEWVKSEGCLVIRFPFTPDVDFSIEGMKAYGKILAARLSGKEEPMVEFRVPFNPSREAIKKSGYKSEKMTVWKDSPEALNMGSAVPRETMEKLKYTLGVANPLTLFRIDTNKYREVHKCAPKKKDVGFQPVIGMQDSVSSALHS